MSFESINRNYSSIQQPLDEGSNNFGFQITIDQKSKHQPLATNNSNTSQSDEINSQENDTEQVNAVLDYRALGQGVLAAITGTPTQGAAEKLGIFDLWRDVDQASQTNSTTANAESFQSIQNLRNLTPSEHTISQEVLGKIFADPNYNTVENQALLKNIANDPNSKLGQDKNGNLWSAQVLDDGSVIWAQSTLQGEIIDGGIVAAHPELTANTVTSYHQLAEGTMAIIAGTPAQETAEQLGVFNIWQEAKQAYQTNSVTANSESFQAIQHLRNLTPSKHTISSEAMNTIFGDPNNNIGNTLKNQVFLKDIANDPNSKLGQDNNGDLWSSRLLADGSVAWTQSTLQGEIVNGGIVAAHPELTTETVQGYDKLVQGTLAMIEGTPAQAAVEQSGIFNGWQEARQAYQASSATANSDSFQAIQNLRNLTPSEHKISKQAMGNIFGNPNNNIGNTTENQAFLIGIANDPNSKIGQDKNGDLWSSRLLGDGSVVWAQSTLQGELVDGGIVAAQPGLTTEDVLLRGMNTTGFSDTMAVQGGIIYHSKVEGFDGVITQSTVYPDIRVAQQNGSADGQYQSREAGQNWHVKANAASVYNEHGSLTGYKASNELTAATYFGGTTIPLMSSQNGDWITEDLMSWTDVYSALTNGVGDNNASTREIIPHFFRPNFNSNIDQDGIKFTHLLALESSIGSDVIHIQKSTPNPNDSDQQYYFVTVKDGYNYLDRNGNPIEGTLGENLEQTHIPLDEYLTWDDWNAPGTRSQQISSKQRVGDGSVTVLPPMIIDPNPGITINVPPTNLLPLPNLDYFPTLPTFDIPPLLLGGIPSFFDIIVSLDELDAPDGDGVWTFSELNYQRRNGGGDDVHAVAGKLNLSGITPSDFANGKINSDGSITKIFNLLSRSNMGSPPILRDGLAYGKVTLTLLPNSGGKVTIANDIYDFDVPGDVFQGLTNGSTYRNLETIGANLLIGGGDPFRIIFDGVGQLGQDNPK
jgi:hypothetical protein